MKELTDMAIINADRLRQWRHELHRRAELGFGEHSTAAYVTEVLTGLGYEVAHGIGGTGLVASISRGSSQHVIGLRADMDALAIAECADHEYVSRTAGVMHACGHDGHMTMVLGAAAALTEAADAEFDGTVRFVFQPAEEHGRGARSMLDDGLLERFPMDAIYGLHNMPGIPSGHLHLRVGGIMGAEDNFEIRITGRGGHAARPHLVVDPIVIGAQIVTALQTIVARTIDPSDVAVVSCTEFITDGTRNAIPTTVIIRGDTRSYDPAVSGQIETAMRTLCDGICRANGATCEVVYTREFAPTINDASCVDVATTAAIATVGATAVDVNCAPLMTSEDFGVFAAEIPGCFSLLGNGTEPVAGGTPLHNSRYDFNDDILEVGVRYFLNVVAVALAPPSRP
jgi:amidohydrolase